MNSKANYSVIGRTVQLQVPLADFSARDKVSLFNDLLVDLGIKDALHEARQLDAEAIRIMYRRLSTVWE